MTAITWAVVSASRNFEICPHDAERFEIDRGDRRVTVLGLQSYVTHDVLSDIAEQRQHQALADLVGSMQASVQGVTDEREDDSDQQTEDECDDRVGNGLRGGRRRGNLSRLSDRDGVRHDAQGFQLRDPIRECRPSGRVLRPAQPFLQTAGDAARLRRDKSVALVTAAWATALARRAAKLALRDVAVTLSNEVEGLNGRRNFALELPDALARSQGALD